MALDEALLTRHIEGAVGPVLRLYGWSPPAVSIGYAQDWNSDVAQDACARHGVAVVRRITGGGAVFHNHEVTYSMVGPVSFFGGDIEKSFLAVSRALAAGLRRLGLEAEFAPINDLLINGKKISGNAQVRRDGTILQHGTVLLRVDREKMFELLTVPEEKLKRRRLARAADRVTSVEAELGQEVTFDEAVPALRAGFEEWLGASLTQFIPDPALESLAERLEKIKYSTPEWNEKRIFPREPRRSMTNMQ